MEDGDLEDGSVEVELAEDGLPGGGDGGLVVVGGGALLGHLVAGGMGWIDGLDPSESGIEGEKGRAGERGKGD